MRKTACMEEGIHIDIKEEIPLTHYILHNMCVKEETLTLFPHSVSLNIALFMKWRCVVLHDLISVPSAEMWEGNLLLPVSSVHYGTPKLFVCGAAELDRCRAREEGEEAEKPMV